MWVRDLRAVALAGRQCLWCDALEPGPATMIVSASPLLALALTATSLSLSSPTVPKGARLTPSSPTAEVGLTIGLEMRDPQVLDQLIARQHDPASSLYHHW